MDIKETKEKKYKLARFVDAAVRKYVVFWVYCCQKKRVVRVRRFVKNQKVGLELCAIINEKLKNGYVLNSDSPLSLGAALDYFEANKHIERKDSKRSYKSLLAIFRAWCNERNILELGANELTKKDIHEYLGYCMQVRGNSAKSRNTKLENLKTIFNFLVERDMMTKNPAHGIKNIRELDSKSQAIPFALVPVIRGLLKEKNSTLYLFTSFVYYCFIRPKELLMLEWSHIDAKNNKIFVPAHISKNGKSEYIIMPASLKEILHEHYQNLPTVGKIFEGVGKRYNALRIAKTKILKNAGLPVYSLYSWKHTGVSAFFRAGVNIKYIQQQCRHTSLDYTDKYLKGLGLIDNIDAFDNIAKI